MAYNGNSKSDERQNGTTLGGYTMSKTYGYARISRKTQNIERQVRNIQQYAPDAIIYQEAYTGRQVNRPKFQELLKKVKK